ncbi:MAG: HK97 family phage prohead protease [Actinobacteria bacterium]|nr:HK97 family phage prohead protease [Actinomycetota bacterium]
MAETTTPPRENLYRDIYPGLELRAEGDDAPPTLFGHFAVFNRWTEIDSIFEGRFMERFAPGAFRKTFRENRDRIRVLFQHGRDPAVGDKPLGAIDTLREDDVGAYYEVPMLDTAYNRELLPGLEAGLYGASFRFRVLKEEFVAEPKRSPFNPGQLPERTVLEAQVREFGPVTFPAYADATAGIRSRTDEFIGTASGIVVPRDLHNDDQDDDVALSDGAGDGHSEPESRDEGHSADEPTDGHSDGQSRSDTPAAPAARKFRTREEWLRWNARKSARFAGSTSSAPTKRS